MKSLINFLQLVYPPISNQCAEWLWEDKAVREYVSRSKLYMLAQRQEVMFEDYIINSDSRCFEFSLSLGEEKQEGLSVRLDDLVLCSDKDVEFEIGPQIFRAWEVKNEERTDNLLYWATTDKFLYDTWRKRFTINGNFNLRKLTKYELYYVGISKKQDSFTRLFKNGHKNRSKILSNETQITPTARLTDEIYIFFFDIEELQISQICVDDDIELSKATTKEWLIADAEKAFIKILNSKYNDEKYENYPQGKDGLYDKGFTRYGYFLDEDIEFSTESRSLKGVHNYFSNPVEHPDFIFTDGESVGVLGHEQSAEYAKNP